MDPLNPNLPFANLLDFSTFAGTSDGFMPGAGTNDAEFGPEENIDFDVFWSWPAQGGHGVQDTSTGEVLGGGIVGVSGVYGAVMPT